MNILFITLLDIRNLNESGIYNDFINELVKRKNNVTIVSATEKRNKGKTELIHDSGTDILKVLIGDITKTSFIKKGINTLLMEKKYKKAIDRYLNDKNFDLIIYTTPPITLNKIVLYLKKKYNAKSYLLLKDIFPQNAVDLNLFSKFNPIYHFFRNKEKQLYQVSDYIGAMSQENLNFIQKYNSINSKTHIFRNAIYETDYTISDDLKQNLYMKYNIDCNKKLLLYGGNLGKPQGPEYIAQIMERFNEINNAQLFIIGSGTHYLKLKNKAQELNNPNISIIPSLPKEEYDQLISISDIGLIFLDYRFTIPNYPSRLTSLLNAGKPILIATDKNTDIGKEVVENGCGLWNESNDIDAFINNANQLISSPNINKCGENSYKFFKKDFTIQKNINNLLDFISSN